MTLVTDKGDSIRSAGSFPPVKVAPGVQLMNGLVQSTITVSPDRRHTAIACQTVDYIDIYDRNLELSKRLRGPIGAEPEFLMQEVQNGMFVLTQEPRFDVFGPCVSGDDGFLVVYKGDEVKTRENPEKEAHTILSFDWNGKPLKCYSFDHPVWCFDVDAEGKKMYVATRDPESLEPEILIYNL